MSLFCFLRRLLNETILRSALAALCCYFSNVVDPRSAQEKFMAAALAEARKGLGLTSPNPAVGAILVEGRKILARGFHRQAGGDHAEVDCLRKIRGRIPARAILFVTLEPCSTRGRTARCVDYILDRHVKRVVIGALDPNPRHSGRGLEMLRQNGVEVESAVMEEDCTRLNEAFNKWIVTGLPFVIAKCAMTLDGRLTRPPRETKFITSPRARLDARRTRAMVDAVLVGAETIRSDNPRLTVRQRRGQREPKRIILTRNGKIPQSARVFSGAGETIVLKTNAAFPEILREIGSRDITSVLIEGGGEVLTAALEAKAIDQYLIYLAPIFAGGRTFAFGGKGARSTDEGVLLRDFRYERLGDDLRITAYQAERNFRVFPRLNLLEGR